MKKETISPYAGRKLAWVYLQYSRAPRGAKSEALRFGAGGS
jgi:hypothetical protein